MPTIIIAILKELAVNLVPFLVSKYVKKEVTQQKLIKCLDVLVKNDASGVTKADAIMVKKIATK